MIDVKHPLRKAYFDLLDGQLSYNGASVPVGDDVIDGDPDVYVILASQTGGDNSSFQTFDSEETIDLDIVHKGGSFVNKNVVDNVAGQIFSLVRPSPTSIGLPPQPGVQVNCVRVTGDRYLDLMLNSADSVMRRIVTFTQKVRQTGSGAAPQPSPEFKSPITQDDFSTATRYENAALKNLAYNLFLNEASVFLTEGVNWRKIDDGGFEILIPGFNAITTAFTIYIILK